MKNKGLKIGIICNLVACILNVAFAGVENFIFCNFKGAIINLGFATICILFAIFLGIYDVID